MFQMLVTGVMLQLAGGLSLVDHLHSGAAATAPAVILSGAAIAAGLVTCGYVAGRLHAVVMPDPPSGPGPEAAPLAPGSRD